MVLNYNAHWFVPAVRAARIKSFRWYDTRHCSASPLRLAGVPLGDIAELLGHKGLAMTRRYAHLSISILDDGVSPMNSTPVHQGRLRKRRRFLYPNKFFVLMIF